MSASRRTHNLLRRLNASRRSIERTDTSNVDGEIRLNKGRWVGRIASANSQCGARNNGGWKCGGELYVDLVKAHLPRRQANEDWGQQNDRTSRRNWAYHSCENIERT